MNIEKIEIEPNQYVWVDKDTKIKDVRPYIGKWHLEKRLMLNKFPAYLTDLSECELIVAASPELNLNVPSYVEWLAEQHSIEVWGDYYDVEPKEVFTASFGENSKADFIKGYKTAEKELFTEDDVREVFHVGRLYQGREGDTTLEQILEQLKQEKNERNKDKNSY